MIKRRQWVTVAIICFGFLVLQHKGAAEYDAEKVGILIGKEIKFNDIDHDGIKERLEYELDSIDGGKAFRSCIKITKKKKINQKEADMVLWDSSDIISYNGMGTLLYMGNKISLCVWIKDFLSGNLDTGAHFYKDKINDEDIDSVCLEAFLKESKMTKAELLKMIHEQKENIIFRYPIEWESFVELVYLPKLNKFIKFNEYEL